MSFGDPLGGASLAPVEEARSHSIHGSIDTRYALGVSPTHDASEIIYNLFIFMKGPFFNFTDSTISGPGRGPQGMPQKNRHK